MLCDVLVVPLLTFFTKIIYPLKIDFEDFENAGGGDFTYCCLSSHREDKQEYITPCPYNRPLEL